MANNTYRYNPLAKRENMNNPETLRKLMSEYGLTRKATAELLELPENTLDSWLKPQHNKSHRPMPDREITFLECLLRPRQKLAEPLNK